MALRPTSHLRLSRAILSPYARIGEPNSVTLAGSELAPNRFGAVAELVRAEIWPII